MKKQSKCIQVSKQDNLCSSYSCICSASFDFLWCIEITLGACLRISGENQKQMKSYC